jgi:hypothetical protein
LRARPEPTQLECLSDAPFLGKLLVLPANVRLDNKVIARYKQSSLFGLGITNEEKKFYNIDTRWVLTNSRVSEIWAQCYKTFYVRNLLMFAIGSSVCPWKAFLA